MLLISLLIWAVVTGLLYNCNKYNYIFYIVWCVLFVSFFIINIFRANSNFLCITNKRVIKKSGFINTHFENCSLANIGNVKIQTSIYDLKVKVNSGWLGIAGKQFHNDTSSKIFIGIGELIDVYNAYKLLNNKLEKNNEALNIKLQK